MSFANDPRTTRYQTAERGEWRIAHVGDLDVPGSEPKATRFPGRLRADALLGTRKQPSAPSKRVRTTSYVASGLSLFARTTARCALLGPPAASLILLVVDYFEYWRAVPFTLADILVAFFVFALPVGYVYGCVPMSLAALLYCALSTASAGMLARRPLTRACVGASCGALASWAWFVKWLNVDQPVYVLAGALVMAALSLGSSSTDSARLESAARDNGNEERTRPTPERLRTR
jgi:hypothetical protein